MRKLLFSGLLLVSFSAPAFASIPPFADIDTDRSGAISMAEAISAGISQSLFAKLDRNMNNRLSPEEYAMQVSPQG